MDEFKNILVAFDGSEDGLKALATSKKLTKDHDAQLTVIYVHGKPFEHPVNVDKTQEGEQLMPQHYVGTGAMSNDAPFVPENQEEVIVEEEMPNQVIHKAQTELTDIQGVTYKELVGKPEEEITNYAKNNNIDLIIIGHRGLGAFKKLVMGSVSQKVLRHSECSVFVVKN